MPDIIHAHVMLPGGWIGCRLGERFRVPVVLTAHSRLSGTDVKSPLLRDLARTTLTQVQRIIAVSPTLAHEIREFSDARPIDVVGNLVRTDYFVPEDSRSSSTGDSPYTFLYVGLLRAEKGIRYLLEAARILHDRGYDSFQVVIGGDGPLRMRLEASAAQLGVSQHCRFLGRLPRAQVKQWMQRCNVLVLPSLRETFGIVLGEAMACGKPVLATRCGGPEWIVTPETGRVVNKADSQALADAMGDFIAGRAVYDSAAVRNSVVARFGEQSFLRQISAVYAQALSG